MNKYLSISLIAVRSNLAYVSEVASRLLFLAVILYIFLRLWQVTFAETNSTVLGGFTLTQMLWYLTIAEAIMLSAPRLSHQIDEDVRSGALAVKLTKPVSYPLYWISASIGERFVRFLLNVAVGSLIAYVLVGAIELNLWTLPFLLVAVFMAFLLDALGHLMVGLSAFWLEDTSGIALIYSRLTMILGGMLLPLSLFPDWLQPILKLLPFSGMVGGPADQFVHASPESFVLLFARQSLGVLVFALCVAGIYRLALQRVSANGG